MQLSLVAIVLCFGGASASVLRANPIPEAKVPEVEKPKVPEAKVPEVEKPETPKVPDAKVPEAKVPDAKVPEVETPETPKVPDAKVPEAKVPDAKVPEAEVPEAEVPEAEVPEAEVPETKCGPTKPWSEHTPLEPDVNDYNSMCQACKIRACNANLPMPGDGGKACRCQYTKVGDTFQTDCKPPFADGVESVGDWHNCPGGVRDCEELEGQCVSATFKMDSAPKPPKVPEMKEPETPEMEPSPTPELKCGATKPWSEHTPMEPNVNSYWSMCQACKIRACNAKLPMPGEGGKACRCQYSEVPGSPTSYTTDCRPPFAEGVENVGEWSNCPGGVRDCEKLEGQCVSAKFKMKSAPTEPFSGAAVKSMMPLAALALFYLA